MKPNLLILLLLFSCCAFSQKKSKVDKIDFCGWKMNDKEKIRDYFREQFDFLKVSDGDTIVDIGASSGTYEGNFLAVNELPAVSFILVDIDPKCLNQQKLSNMLLHYSMVKGDSIKNRFQIVQNTPDSLWLPLSRFQKVWLLNTLHEIRDQPKMIRDICFILRPGGELVLLENPPKYEGQLHGGCHQPLLSFQKINELLTSNGFRFAEKKEIIRKRNFDIVMSRFIKE